MKVPVRIGAGARATGVPTAMIRAELDRAMTTPSPNPRYCGLTPVEAIRRMEKPKPESEIAKQVV